MNRLIEICLATLATLMVILLALCSNGCTAQQKAELKSFEVAAQADAYTVSTYIVGAVGDMDAAVADWDTWSAAHPAAAASIVDAATQLATKAGVSAKSQAILKQGLTKVTAPVVLAEAKKIQAGLAPTVSSP